MGTSGFGEPVWKGKYNKGFQRAVRTFMFFVI